MGAEKRLGRYVAALGFPPSVSGYGSVVGKREGEGPLAASFDIINTDTSFGEKTWEKAESHMQAAALQCALDKAGLPPSALDFTLAGDLLNQCISSSFALRDSGLPFLGLYGACSTMAEGLLIASMLIDGGFACNAAAVTSSHFCSAERQYRTPLEYGGQRTPSAQWTATGAGAVVLTADGAGPYITHIAAGRVVDRGVKDANNMGAAMAPAAYETLRTLFAETSTAPENYDLIVTGDLASIGARIVRDMFEADGVTLGERYVDCGELIYDRSKQDVHAGGSGCGCSAAVLCGHLLNNMRAKNLNKIIFAGTGALLSPISVQQGESIPCICHAVVLANARP